MSAFLLMSKNPSATSLAAARASSYASWAALIWSARELDVLAGDADLLAQADMSVGGLVGRDLQPVKCVLVARKVLPEHGHLLTRQAQRASRALERFRRHVRPLSVRQIRQGLVRARQSRPWTARRLDASPKMPSKGFCKVSVKPVRLPRGPPMPPKLKSLSAIRLRLSPSESNSAPRAET